MILKIQENSIDLTELKQRLTEAFQDTYAISKRRDFGVVLAKTSIVGVTVILRKDKMHISGNFPSAWMVMVYTFSLILLGIIIPLLLYYIFLHKKMKVEEKKVAAFIQQTYADKILA